MLTRIQKSKIVEELTDNFKRQKIAIFSDNHGISVSKLQSLRRLLKKEEAEYKVAKKTLLDRALEEANVEFRTKELQGEIGVTFGYSDEIIPAKTLLKFSRSNETFKLLGGILGQRLLSAKDVVILAKLPSKDVLIGKFIGTLQAPMRELVNVLQGNIRNLVTVLYKIKNNKSA